VSSAPFAVLGIGYTSTTDASGQNTKVTSGPTPQNIQFSYDGASNSYSISLPSFQPGKLTNPGYSGSEGQIATSSTSQVTLGTSNTLQQANVFLFTPGSHFSPYTYTSFGQWGGSTGQTADGGIDHISGQFVYGIPTLSAGMPTTGSAAYSASIRGSTNDGFYIGGAATFQFDFAAGTLSGHFDPSIYDWDQPVPIGRYDFGNTIYASGSTTFSGDLVRSGVGTGSFQGQFTGPKAEELMARWSAPLSNPLAGGQASTMYGVLIGKKN